MRFAFILGLGLLPFSAALQAHEFFSTKITWSREISRVVAKSCLGCHREGGKAFSLETFEAARPWAKAIKEEVLMRRMPPWGAAKGFGDFQNDKGLSQDEISLIADWVEGGAPEGDKTLLPKLGVAKDPKPEPRWIERPLLQPPLPAKIDLAGISVRGPVPAGTQVVAELPDGSTEPLIWIVDPKSASARNFTFRERKVLPAGTRIVTSKSGGAWKLLIAR